MASKKTALSVEHVSMKFNLSSQKVDNIKEYVIKMLKKELMYQEFWALKDVNFEIKRGDRVGIMGLNGAGKSTLLKVIAGVLKPTEGTVKCNGKIVPLLELGAGFDKQYTGAENIYLYGAVLGYSKEFIDKKYKDIVEFSELGKFIDVPIKNYSSGMKARLGFSIATIVEPEILILDEVLSVGDKRFRKKCEARIQSMFDKGVTVLFVSHSTDQVLRMCNKGILLEHGRLVAQGEVEDIVDLYDEKLGMETGRLIKFLITEGKKMKKVITYGTYDLLHVGHINLLRRAKELGDYLIVVLSSDEFNAIKGKKAYHSYEDRKIILEAIKYVDEVLPEYTWEQKIDDVVNNNVDIFVMGDDWKGKFDFLKDYCEVVYLPRTEGISTSKIKQDLGLGKSEA